MPLEVLEWPEANKPIAPICYAMLKVIVEIIEFPKLDNNKQRFEGYFSF